MADFLVLFECYLNVIQSLIGYPTFGVNGKSMCLGILEISTYYTAKNYVMTL